MNPPEKFHRLLPLPPVPSQRTLLAGLACPLQHVLNVLCSPRHKAALICVLQPEDEAPLVLLGKEVVVKGSVEAAQVQEAWEGRGQVRQDGEKLVHRLQLRKK